MTLFSSGRAVAQAEDAALPAPPPPPPSPASAPAAQAQQLAPGSPLTGDSPSVSPPRADAALPTAPPARSGWDDPERNWYGWQLLINDFVALGSLAGAAAADLKENAALAVIVPAAVVYDLGSPTIHWLHGRKRIAAASFGVRVGVPFVGVLIGLALGSCSNDQSSSSKTCRSRAAGYGALAGFAGATAIDASLFAFDAPAREKLPAIGFRWAPVLAARDGGATLGVVGVF